MQHVIDKHYRRLAKQYDQFLYYSPDFVRTLTKKMIARLELHEDDVLADIGCGTGMYALDILSQVRLQNPILGVDPFPEMLAQIPEEAPIERIAEDALTFAEHPGRYNKVLVKETIHHVQQRQRFFENMFGTLPSGGRVLLVHVPPRVQYPLFKEALARCESWHADPEELVRLMKAAGFQVERDELNYRHRLPKEHYFAMVQGCYMSVLTSFNEDELQTGLEEMQRTYQDQSELEFVDHFDYLVGLRP